MNKSFCLAVESFQPGRGGIARVARLMARAIVDLRGSDCITCVALNDGESHLASSVRNYACGGSRLRFFSCVQSAAIERRAIIFDSAGMARAQMPLVSWLCRSACWIHGVEVWEKARRSRLSAISRCGFVFANSEYTLSRAEALHGKFRRSSVCHLSTEQDCFPEPLGDRLQSGPMVLSVGRMDRLQKYKGHDELLECWAGVAEKIRNATLVFVGSGSDQARLVRKSEDLGLTASVRFLGQLSEDALEKQWNDASVFAMPSRGEGFGLVYIEAMRHGVPVIASVHDAGAEINAHEVSGINVDLDVPGALLDALVAVLTSVEYRRRLSVGAAARWQREFCYPRFRDRIAGVLDQWLG